MWNEEANNEFSYEYFRLYRHRQIVILKRNKKQYLSNGYHNDIIYIYIYIYIYIFI